MSSEEAFSTRLARIRERIAVATQHTGRSVDEITLVAVSKRQPMDALLEAYAAGLSDFGENYVQEAQEKHDSQAVPDCRWHMLGHLQSNKARVAVETFDMIQSVDSVRLASLIGKAAQAQEQVQKILLQVHLGAEETKFGFDAQSVLDAAEEVRQMPGVIVLGLMGIASQTDDARPQFRGLRRVFEALPEQTRVVLSMGMTNDFEVAIEEGATMIRIGTALFGPRH
jgi:pyridoxal phosphate enzyme (YggS family)